MFRLAGLNGNNASHDDAVDLLLSHWTTRAPLGPCRFGIGTIFLQVSYPFASYNLFFYVYVLSFYARASPVNWPHGAIARSSRTSLWRAARMTRQAEKSRRG